MKNSDKVNELLEASDQQVKRVDFDVVTNKISPSVEKILEKMTKSADQFKKWRKLKGLKLPEHMKKALNTSIIKADVNQEEWHTMVLDLSRLDKKHQLSRKAFESGGAKIITQQKIDTFYGEEHGKKWQNIFEFIQQIELQIIAMIHDKKLQVNQVINHLSISKNEEELANVR